MTFQEGQIHWLNALILKKHATIVSGAYKFKTVWHGSGKDEGNKYTEEELLQDELEAMGRQIDWLNEAVEGLRNTERREAYGD